MKVGVQGRFLYFYLPIIVDFSRFEAGFRYAKVELRIYLKNDGGSFLKNLKILAAIKN